jgi:23S rRNA (cytidine1920-2'-O)/16S rRNA (cytidine1409-2'-O)-methyltransferase
MSKRRLDVLLVDRGLADSPKKAQALIMAGQVTVAERPVSKPGTLIEESAPLEVAASPRYAGRGGEKLEHALRAFGIDVSGLVAVDIGASTGGFTDCLLQHGAARVYAIDVGKGQLDYRLRQDPRVVAMEGVNVRHLVGLPEPVGIATADVSFISLRLVLPVVRRLLEGSAGVKRSPSTGSGRTDMSAPGRGNIIVLFKPQFEAAKEEVPRGGVIKDPQMHATLIGRFAAWCVRNRFRVLDLAASPVLGAAGNREFLLWLRSVEARHDAPLLADPLRGPG